MTCREFEDAMSEEFGSVDKTHWQSVIVRGAWDEISHHSTYTDHLVSCDGCVTSLYQFLDVRQWIEYRSQPCFHVAYYSGEVPERCLERHLGLYSIITDRESQTGIVIGFCPWCGVNLPVGIEYESSKTGQTRPAVET